jgi:RNA polymerase sigma-54 factor
LAYRFHFITCMVFGTYVKWGILMKLTHDVFLAQQQKLVMTPELRQAIAILQMSTLELNQHIQQQLEENPFLEEKETEETIEPDAEHNENMEEWLEFFNDRDIEYNQREQKEETSFENMITRKPSLYEHLEFQLQLTVKQPEDLNIGEYIIGNIDNNGYLSIGLDEVATRFNTTVKHVEEVLSIVQTFHPHGVGARDLAECLMLQLRHYGKETELAQAIVSKHLDDVARGRLSRIAQQLDTSIYQVQEICDLIRTLDPRPGLQYSNDEEIKYIIPDVIVQELDGEFIIVVNDSNFPRLGLNQTYQNVLKQPGAFTPDVRKYMEEKMGSAVWLIKSIEQRRMTLYRVARCIVDIQTDFLRYGVKYIKPLNLKQVADRIEVHESTVSRATTNKYIQTPQGLFEFKYFFSSGVQSDTDNSPVSSKSIKYLIEEMINNEDATQPLSDQTIGQLLKQKGIRISRRTVAKYRQELGILSTVARKRYDS